MRCPALILTTNFTTKIIPVLCSFNFRSQIFSMIPWCELPTNIAKVIRVINTTSSVHVDLKHKLLCKIYLKQMLSRRENSNKLQCSNVYISDSFYKFLNAAVSPHVRTLWSGSIFVILLIFTTANSKTVI